MAGNRTSCCILFVFLYLIRIAGNHIAITGRRRPEGCNCFNVDEGLAAFPQSGTTFQNIYSEDAEIANPDFRIAARDSAG
jgi:hypothetical protein